MAFQNEGLAFLLERSAKENPMGVFGIFDGSPVTFTDLNALANTIATQLRGRGLNSGDRVGVMMQNSPQSLAVIFALAKAGLVWVPLNAKQVGEGLRYILEHSAPSLVVADAGLVPVIKSCGGKISSSKILTNGVVKDCDQLPVDANVNCSFASTHPAPDDPFAIMYTSGTTGRPKGVIVTHTMLRLSAEGTSLVSAVKSDDVMFVWEPLYHIGGAQLLPLPMTHNVRLAFVERFSASRFWQQARKFGASHIHHLGGILQILLKQPSSGLDRTHGVRIAWGGGCPKEIWKTFEHRFNIEIRECYGMTEVSSITTYNDKGVVGSVGTAVPWFEVRVIRSDGSAVDVDERGEIVVHTSIPGAVFPGYLDNPEATGQALRQGVMHTGDLGSWDGEGNLFFHGRMSDSVRCRGENVSAWEVEHVAAKHPDVEDCAMIGVAAEIGEQEIKLFVKPRNKIMPDPAAISNWLSKRLAPYQNPRYIAVIEDFERTPSLRIVKHKLSAETVECWDRQFEEKL